MLNSWVRPTVVPGPDACALRNCDTTRVLHISPATASSWALTQHCYCCCRAPVLLFVPCSKPTDVDMFRFVVPSTIGRVTITVQLRPVAPWGSQVQRSNLHSNVVVRRGSTQIMTANGFSVGPFTTPRQQSGTFFVSVAPTGVVGEYTSYGSRGQYELTVTYQAA